MIKNPGGLLVEVTDGTAEYNNEKYRLSLFYDLAKNSVIRMVKFKRVSVDGKKTDPKNFEQTWL